MICTTDCFVSFVLKSHGLTLCANIFTAIGLRVMSGWVGSCILRHRSTHTCYVQIKNTVVKLSEWSNDPPLSFLTGQSGARLSVEPPRTTPAPRRVVWERKEVHWPVPQQSPVTFLLAPLDTAVTTATPLSSPHTHWVNLHATAARRYDPPAILPFATTASEETLHLREVFSESDGSECWFKPEIFRILYC